jgi:ribosomal protein S6--L-glutamate ligase
MLGHLEQSGVQSCNSSDAINTARDTLRTLTILKNAGLSVPRTARLLSIKDLRLAQKSIPGPPWILKTFTGAMGIGTMRVMAPDQLEAVAATIWALRQPILLQEFIPSADRTAADMRALVVDGKIIGAIRRRAARGEFRANVHRGGKPEPVLISRKDADLALKAARAMRLGITGVDWIESERGPVFLEVNATPGFKGFESATGIDAAGAMIDYAAKLGGMG